MINAGKYNHKIEIYRTTIAEDADGFQTEITARLLRCHASVKTTKGFTLIMNGSDFEKATTNFTIRRPSDVEINRDDIVMFKGKRYQIEYLNDVDEEGVELEIQAKEVTH